MALRNPTFAEREGAKPLPAQLDLGTVSTEARAKIWHILHSRMVSSRVAGVRSTTGQPYLSRWTDILRDHWVDIDHRFADQYPNGNTGQQIEYAKEKMLSNYADFLTFIEHIVSHSSTPSYIPDLIQIVFVETGCAYRIVDGLITPIASAEMANSYQAAFDSLKGEFPGAAAHLSAAARALTAGDFAGSIRESIHAVESVARKISGAQTLGPALTKIGASGLHPALQKGFMSLYGFTSDEEGIRHALLEGNVADVGEQEALYMLGSCASFAAYLKNKFILSSS